MSVLTLYLDIDIEDQSPDSNMQRINSQTSKVLKRADAHTILPYTDSTPKSKVTVALENIRIQDALMNF